MNNTSSTQNRQEGVSVKVQNLHKGFNGQEVLRGINFEVSPGEIFVIMGPSGSGKSVLLKHIIGLEEPDAGEILVNNESILNPDILEHYRLAMVFQTGGLLHSLTVGENVGLYLSEHRLRPSREIARIVAEKLALVGLKGQEDRLPNELSGGMRKRAAIARALVMEPQLILYDEPTSELDPLSATVIADEIVNLQNEIAVTSIVVTHDRELAFGIADRIAMINDGRILAVGTPDEIRRNTDPLIQQFLHSDFKTAKTHK